MIVYLIKNLVNGKVYVGQTVHSNLQRRWSQHLNNARSSATQLIARAIRRYGEENFAVLELCRCSSIEELNEREREFIFSFQSFKPESGYNLTYGGQNGTKLTAEVRARLSAMFKGRPISEEQKAKISATLKGRPSPKKGRKLSEETKAKLRALTGSRASMFGRKHSEETKAKMREKAMGNRNGLGHAVAKKHREILSEARKNEWAELPKERVIEIMKLVQKRKSHRRA